MINEMVMRKLFLPLSLAMLTLFLCSLVAVSAQSSQNLGVGQAVAVQCYHSDGTTYDCSQSSTTTNTTTTTTTTASASPTSSTTTSITTQAAPTAATTTSAPTETSSAITTSANQATGLDLSNPTTQAGIAIIIVAFAAAAILLQKGHLGRGSTYRYQYKP